MAADSIVVDGRIEGNLTAADRIQLNAKAPLRGDIVAKKLVMAEGACIEGHVSVGAHLANAAAAGNSELFYWRERHREVDFVVRAGRRLVALEVKSGRVRDAHSGIEAFSAAFKPQRKLLIGGDGIPLEKFLGRSVDHWIRE